MHSAAANPIPAALLPGKRSRLFIRIFRPPSACCHFVFPCLPDSACPAPSPKVLSLLFRILEKLDLNQVRRLQRFNLSSHAVYGKSLILSLDLLQVWVQNVVVAAAPGSSVWQMDLSLDQR